MTVKLTKETREERSGGMGQCGSRVTSASEKLGEKSTVLEPSRTTTRPPCFCVSRFSTGFSTGSRFSMSVTISALPNRSAVWPGERGGAGVGWMTTGSRGRG